MRVPDLVFDAEPAFDEPSHDEPSFDEPVFDRRTFERSRDAAIPLQGSEAAPPSRAPCPACGEMIVAGAAKCRFCGEIFDPALKRKRKKRRPRSSEYGVESLSVGDWIVAFFCSGIGLIAAIVWMLQGKTKGMKMLAVSLGAAVFWNVVVGILRALILMSQEKPIVGP